jgi:hypothetical protein
MQTQQAAGQFATSRNESPAPAHLLVAIIDQADADAMSLLLGAGIDPVELRRVALEQLAAPPDLTPIEIPHLTPAGYMDRPILDESELDPDAWRILVWRQAHLPLDALRTSRDWRCLCDLEAETSDRLYRRLKLHPDQELSLAQHHQRRVQQLAHDARPDLVPPLPPERRHDGPPVVGFLTAGGRPRHWQPQFLSFTIGWGTWFANRWSGVLQRRDWIQTRLFALRTRAAYKGAPKPVQRNG